MTTHGRQMSSKPDTMRAARLHGVRDLRVETLPVPEPAATDLLVRVEACGVCPTDVRKFMIGTDESAYPLNPGHEWLGRVVAVGADVDGWEPGDRVYGDTYAGYAEYALLDTRGSRWSYGPLRLDDEMPADRAVFIEPLADCVHAVRNQARVADGDNVVVVGAGQMGLQMVAVARTAGARVLAVDPLEQRRELAAEFGADETVEPDGWEKRAREWAGGGGVAAVILALGRADAVDPALAALAPGGRLVLFAGFGDQAVRPVDLNLVHYQELTIVGSEWVGTPPNERLDCYEEALALLGDGGLDLERLVTGHCTLDTLDTAFADVERHQAMKMVLNP
jgi:L-iditol 2-dehydrogenase